MSRIGKQPVTVPSGVKVAVNGATVNVEGPKGKLSRTFDGVTFALEGNPVHVRPAGDDRRSGAGLARPRTGRDGHRLRKLPERPRHRLQVG